MSDALTCVIAEGSESSVTHSHPSVLLQFIGSSLPEQVVEHNAYP